MLDYDGTPDGGREGGREGRKEGGINEVDSERGKE